MGVRLCLTVFGCVRLCLVMFGCVWLFGEERRGVAPTSSLTHPAPLISHLGTDHPSLTLHLSYLTLAPIIPHTPCTSQAFERTHDLLWQIDVASPSTLHTSAASPAASPASHRAPSRLTELGESQPISEHGSVIQGCDSITGPRSVLPPCASTPSSASPGSPSSPASASAVPLILSASSSFQRCNHPSAENGDGWAMRW